MGFTNRSVYVDEQAFSLISIGQKHSSVFKTKPILMHFRFKPRPFSFILIVGLYNRFPRLFFLLTLHQNETTLNFVKMCHEFSLLQMAHFASKCAAVSIMFCRGVDWYTTKFHCRIFILCRFPQNAAWMTFLPMSLKLLNKNDG